MAWQMKTTLTRLATVVEADLRFNFYDGLDELVRAGVATSGFQAPSSDNIFVSIRKAITTLRAACYSPDTLALTPTASETIDTIVRAAANGASRLGCSLPWVMPCLPSAWRAMVL